MSLSRNNPSMFKELRRNSFFIVSIDPNRRMEHQSTLACLSDLDATSTILYCLTKLTDSLLIWRIYDETLEEK